MTRKYESLANRRKAKSDQKPVLRKKPVARWIEAGGTSDRNPSRKGLFPLQARRDGSGLLWRVREPKEQRFPSTVLVTWTDRAFLLKNRFPAGEVLEDS